MARILLAFLAVSSPLSGGYATRSRTAEKWNPFGVKPRDLAAVLQGLASPATMGSESTAVSIDRGTRKVAPPIRPEKREDKAKDMFDFLKDSATRAPAGQYAPRRTVRLVMDDMSLLPMRGRLLKLLIYAKMPKADLSKDPILFVSDAFALYMVTERAEGQAEDNAVVGTKYWDQVASSLIDLCLGDKQASNKQRGDISALMKAMPRFARSQEALELRAAAAVMLVCISDSLSAEGFRNAIYALSDVDERVRRLCASNALRPYFPEESIEIARQTLAALSFAKGEKNAMRFASFHVCCRKALQQTLPTRLQRYFFNELMEDLASEGLARFPASRSETLSLLTDMIKTPAIASPNGPLRWKQYTMVLRQFGSAVAAGPDQAQDARALKDLLGEFAKQALKGNVRRDVG